MLEKKIQENPLPDEPKASAPAAEDKSKMSAKPTEKTTTVPLPVPDTPSFTKTPPNDLYRKLLPGVLFLLTFVTVMTMLLIYMDTVALGAQQFRLNMTRDYELSKIPQSSDALVLYVKQFHLSPRTSRAITAVPEPTPQLEVLNKIYGDKHNGTFVEFLPRGARDNTTVYLEAARGWRGVAVRAAARDYLELKGGNVRALHACLSQTEHPREVTYQESDNDDLAFSPRVLCLPLYTVLLAAEASDADYVVLGGRSVLSALQHLPFDEVNLKVIEVRSSRLLDIKKTSGFLESKNYTIAATFKDSVMYSKDQV